MKSKVIVHIDMDAFFAAIEQRDNPTLRGKPVVIGADPKKGKGRGVVSTCSYEARCYGIKSAMPISEAYRRCKTAHFLPGNMRKYKQVSNQIFSLLQEFTDRIEPVSIDEAFLDITDSYHFYKTPANACCEMKKRIKEQLNLNASIGLSPVKMVSKIASDLSKPDGLIEVKSDQIRPFLWRLSIGRLWGVGKKTERALNQLGIYEIKQLAMTDREILFNQFGENGLHLHDLANGIDPRNVEQRSVMKSVSHEHTFNEDTSDQDQIIKSFSYLSQKVSRRLRRYGLKGKTISIKVRTEDFRTITRAKTVSVRTNYFETIFSICKEMYTLFDAKNKRIRLIGVKVSQFEDPYVTDTLFSDPKEEKREKVHVAVDLIKDRFGEKAIQRGTR